MRFVPLCNEEACGERSGDEDARYTHRDKASRRADRACKWGKTIRTKTQRDMTDIALQSRVRKRTLAGASEGAHAMYSTKKVYGQERRNQKDRERGLRS